MTGDHHSTNDDSAAVRVVTGVAIGLASAALALAPWLLTGAKLPLQNLWHMPVLPEEMPFGLLPVNQYYAIRIAVLLIVGGMIAGLAVRWTNRAAPVPTWSAAAGVLLAQSIAVIQSFTVVADGLGIGDSQADARALLYFGGMLAGTIVAVLLAQAAFWLASRRSVGAVSLGLTLSAVPFASWIVDGAAMLSGPAGLPTAIASVERWLPALIVGVVLGWCGIRPLRRLGLWVMALAALWVTPAVFTSVSSALGMRVLNGDLHAMREVGAQIFPLALGIGVFPVLCAVTLGALITAVRPMIQRRVRRSGSSDDAIGASPDAL